MTRTRDRSIPVGDWRQIRQFRSHIPPTDPVDRDPCPYCATRRDIGCRHMETAR